MKDLPIVRFAAKPLEDYQVRVRKLFGRESISQLFEYEIHLICLNAKGVKAEDLILQQATLVWERKTRDGKINEERRIFGIVANVVDRFIASGKHTEYILTFVPRAWQSTLTETCDVFLDMKVQQIIEKKLKASAGLASQDVEFRLQGSYDKREFVVQYQETDLNFISRLAEHEGIFFFFEHQDDREIMVFADDSSHFKPTNPATVKLELRGDQTNVYALEADHRAVTKAYRERDYNYRNPSVDVLGENELAANGGGHFDEYGPNARTPGVAKTLAQVRSQEMGNEQLSYRGRGEIPSFTPGATVTLEHASRGDYELLLIEVLHSAVQPVFSDASQEDHAYTNDFRAINKSATYRPPRLARKPRVEGVVNALIESESPGPLGAIDSQGRYHVSFMFDPDGERQKGKGSLPVRMSQPSAGPDRGFHLPLKVGTEVIISFVNGDPDRPVIVGAVPNPRTPSPVTAANAEKSGMRTNVSQWFFDDTKPRFKLEVDGTNHVWQAGMPDAPAIPDLGFSLATVGNQLNMINGMQTTAVPLSTDWFKTKILAAEAGFALLVGVPSPIPPWQQGQAQAKSVDDFEKSVASATGQAAEVELKAATAARKMAENTKKAYQEKLVKKQGKKYPDDAKTVTNADGSTRRESKAEFTDRTAKQGATPAQKAQLAALDQDSASAAKTAQAAANNRALAAPAPSDEVVDADTSEAAAAGDSTADKSKSSAERAQKKALDGLTSLRRACLATIDASSHRNKGFPTGYVGSFKKNCNVQTAFGSIALVGFKNAFVTGRSNATLYCPLGSAALVGKSVHVKTIGKCEIAGRSHVRVSSRKLIDIHTAGKLKIVADDDTYGPKDTPPIPADNTMLVHSKEGITMLSETKDITVTAKQNFVFKAEEEDTSFTTKKNFKVEATEKNVEMDAKAKAWLAHGKSKVYLGAGAGSGFGLVSESNRMQIGKLSSANELSGAKVDSSCNIYIKSSEIKTAVRSCQMTVKAGSVAAKAGGVGLDVKKNGPAKLIGKKVLLG